MDGFQRVAQALACLVAGGAAVMMLSGCSSDTDEIADRSPGAASIGPAVDCPGEFLQSLAKERTAGGTSVEVEEVDDSERFAGLVPEAPMCTADLVGDGTLPSGAAEPVQHVALYEGSRQADVEGGLAAAGYAPASGAWHKDDVILGVQERTASNLGIDGSATYTLIIQMESAELAELRG